MRTHAETVVVGAGIVGCSAAAFLAAGGARDVMVIDRGALFRTGGSTSHAPGLVFQNNATRTVSKLAQWTTATYSDVSAEGEPCWFPVGSLEVAATPERWVDLHRKWGWARANGLTAELLTPVETGRLLPLLDPSTILGAIRVEGDGLVRAVVAAERLAERAERAGVEFAGETRVTAIDVRDGRIHGVETDRGRISCERVLICGGIWGPLLGRMAGVALPLQPCAHPYTRSTPLAKLVGTCGIVEPVWRHQDASMYLWQEGERYGVGTYRHEPVIIDPEALRDDVPAPADLPFDEALMAPGQREAERLVPALRGQGITDRLLGLFSFTPDAQSLVGEVDGVRGLWAAEAVWVTHGAGVGRAVAQLMLAGSCELDLRELDVNRFAPHMTARSYFRERGAQQYREVYDVIHPRQPIARPREVRRPPWFERQRALGAVCFESNGWERAQWYEANAALPLPALGAERSGWNARFWSPIAAAEHRATRERAGLFDLGTFQRIEVLGKGALAALERLSPSALDRPIGRVSYAVLLNDRGGIESDVTVTRLAADRFLILAGAAGGPRDLAWVCRHTRDLADVKVRDVTAGWCGLGLWGPRAPEIARALAEAEDGTPPDLSEAAFAPYTIRSLVVGGIPCLALRMSYAGEDGWELHTTTDYGGALWDAVWAAGQPYGLVAAGGTAMDSLRLERGFRALGSDLRGEHTPHEAGLGFTVSRKRGGFIGAAALATHEPAVRLRCLVLDDPEVVLTGKEPIVHGDEAVGFVTSANFGYTVGASLALGYVPVAFAEPGTRLTVEYFGERIGATVAEEPLYESGQMRMTPALSAVT